MVTSPNTEGTVQYIALAGPAFDDAVCGAWDGKGDVTPSWLQSPKLKYYHPSSALQRGPDQRQFFLAVQPAQDNDNLGKLMPVGMIELEVSPFDDTVVWLKYLTVHPVVQRKGIARTLLDMMVEHLKTNPRKLVRSRPSEEGALRIKGFIDELLNNNSLSWSQGSA